MCGICGVITKKEITRETIISMNNTIHYRGPDDDGIFINSVNEKLNIGLAHRRLSIMDLSSLGHQPMKDEEEKITIVFNGEIYNFKEIRDELLDLDYRFKSNTDTEVIINSYKEWGINCIKKFNGMFAIVLYDKEKEEIYLIRDRMGVKPLYYFFDDEDLIFASELKPIMKWPYFKKEIDFEALALYLNHGYITEPKSIFKKTYKVKPGSYIKYKNGKVEEFIYWNIYDFINAGKNIYKNEDECVDELEKIIKSSINYRMISDVPIGAFLSGGIDSTLVAAIMQSVSTEPIKTFTIGFADSEFNEADDARKIAEYLGTDHNEKGLSFDEAEKLLFDMAIYYDEPFADNSQLATYLVSKIAKDKVTVALSGDGGDELFCGYTRYFRAQELKKFKNISHAIKFIATNNTKSIIFNRKLNKVSKLSNDINIINADYEVNDLFVSNLLKYKYKKEKKYYNVEKLKNIDIKKKYMINDILTYLPDDILTKVDRASMAVSLESRNPLLDYRIAEFSFKCDDGLILEKEPKYLLKKLLYRYVPKELVDRPKKGFGVPVHKWLHNEYKHYVYKYLGMEHIKQQNIFDSLEVANLLKKFEKNNDEFIDKIIWKMLIFQLWYEKYMEA